MKHLWKFLENFTKNVFGSSLDCFFLKKLNKLGIYFAILLAKSTEVVMFSSSVLWCLFCYLATILVIFFLYFPQILIRRFFLEYLWRIAFSSSLGNAFRISSQILFEFLFVWFFVSTPFQLWISAVVCLRMFSPISF